MILRDTDKDFIRENEDKEISEIALRLKKGSFDAIHVNFILNQISGRKISKKKIPSWYANENIIYPIHLSIEQSSSEKTSRYKASLINEKLKTFVDLTGGFGVDFYYLSQNFERSVYVEQNYDLCNFANNNFDTLNLTNYEIINGDGVDYLKNSLHFADVIYIDPARRDTTGRKIFRIEDCTPNILDIQDILLKKSKKVIIKFSPMLDIKQALGVMPKVEEVHVVSVDNECKELLFVLSDTNNETIKLYAVNLKKDDSSDVFSFEFNDELNSKAILASNLHKYLYEPNSSILKAGAYNYISEYYSLLKLDNNSHLYTSDNLFTDFPGRIFKIIDSFSPNKNNIRDFVKKNNKANITTRNYPLSVAEIRKEYKIQDGGDIYIFATTMSPDIKVWIVCDKI